MEKELISVIGPVYNVEPYLEKCVRSVLGQTYGLFELLLIDDGSTDESGMLCDRLAETDGRIRVIHQENRGLAAARNRGIEASEGRYLIFLDSDDFWSADVLEKLLESIQKNGAELALFPLFYEDENGEPLPAPPFPAPGCYSGDALLTLLCTEGTPQLVTAVNRLAERSLWQTLRFPDGRYHEDEYTAHRLYAAVGKAVLTDQPRYHYLQRSGSITRQESPERRADGVDAFLDRAEFLKADGRTELTAPTLRSALHWYLTILTGTDFRRLKSCARLEEVRARFRKDINLCPSLFSGRESLAVRHPALWQLLHRLRHRSAKGV